MFGTCLSIFSEDLFWENGSFSPANLVGMFPMISSMGLKCVPRKKVKPQIVVRYCLLGYFFEICHGMYLFETTKTSSFCLESACSKKSFYIILSSSARQHMSTTAPHSAKWCQQRIHTKTFDYRWAQRDSKKFNAD